jgi:FAD synthetase
MRLKMIQSLRVVDKAVLGGEGDMYEIVAEVKPDIIAIGHDQTHEPDRIKDELSKRGVKAEVVRLPQFDHDLDGTRKIIQKVINWYQFQEKIKKVEGE